MRFELTILGCNAAIPAHNRHPSAQVLNIHDHLYLIDCGEGTQMRLSDFRIKMSRINQIFISHCHGDHFFGLIGLINSMSLAGRSEPLSVFSPLGLEKVIRCQLDLSGSVLSYPLEFIVLEVEKNEKVYENGYVEVWTVPLRHRIPTVGFLFREKQRLRNILSEKITEYEIPYASIPSIKKGENFKTKDGRIISNEELTLPPPSPRTYAYCSDTIYTESIIPCIMGVDLLFHEATFMHEQRKNARETYHSTTVQAARIAAAANAKKLVIGHYSSRYIDLQPLREEAAKVFPNTFLGLEGMTYPVELQYPGSESSHSER